MVSTLRNASQQPITDHPTCAPTPPAYTHPPHTLPYPAHAAHPAPSHPAVLKKHRAELPISRCGRHSAHITSAHIGTATRARSSVIGSRAPAAVHRRWRQKTDGTCTGTRRGDATSATFCTPHPFIPTSTLPRPNQLACDLRPLGQKWRQQHSAGGRQRQS